jgi:hypothetical protein
MKFHIAANGNVKIIEFPDEQIDKFYERIQHKYHDHLFIEQSETAISVLVVIDTSGDTVAAAEGLVAIMGKKWRQDGEWEQWNAKVNFWDKVKCLDGFFNEKFPYVSLIKIIPETAIPEDSYDFFERGGSNRLIEDIERIARVVQAAHETVTSLPAQPTSKSSKQAHPSSSSKTTAISPITRRNNPQRVKDENAAIKEFWTRTLVGERVTQGEIAIKHQLGKQALSKKHYKDGIRSSGTPATRQRVGSSVHSFGKYNARSTNAK